jgi:hypothetical protein
MEEMSIFTYYIKREHCKTSFQKIITFCYWGHLQNCDKLLLDSSRHVCQSVCIEQLGSHWMDFHENLHVNIFRKSVNDIQDSLKSDINYRYCTWMCMYIYDNISLNSSKNDKYLSHCYRENQYTHFISIFFFSKIVPFMRWRGKVWYSQTGHKWQHNMAQAFCLLVDSGYRDTLGISTPFTFPQQQWLRERDWILRLCVCCLPCLQLV